DMAHEEEYQEIFLDEPEIWGVENLGGDSVDVRRVIKTQPAKQWAVSRELRRRIKYAFDAAGIEIPHPQRTVWLRTEDEPPEVGGTTKSFERPTPDGAAVDRALKAAKPAEPSAPAADFDAVQEEVVGEPESPRADRP